MLGRFCAAFAIAAACAPPVAAVAENDILDGLIAAGVVEPTPQVEAGALADDLTWEADAAAPVRVAAASSESIPAPPSEGRTTPAPTDVLSRGLAGVTVDGAPSARIAAQSERIKPENQIRDVATERFDAAPLLVDSYSPMAGRPGVGFAWAAPALYHRALLFEQPNVERYGHQCGIWRGDQDTQVLVSGAHFFGSVAALPYLIGAHGCCEPEYVLGSYRPGSCNPHQPVLPRLSCRGLAAQAAATTGLIYFVP